MHGQFLTEAVLLCLVGGLIGLLLGRRHHGRHLPAGRLDRAHRLGTVVLAILASAAVGVIFGFVPARRAARLNPIDALRYE